MDSVCQICKGNDYVYFDETCHPCPECVQTEPEWEIPNETK